MNSIIAEDLYVELRNAIYEKIESQPETENVDIDDLMDNIMDAVDDTLARARVGELRL